MAKLSAHGNEIGRLIFLTYVKAYMEDGTVLKNIGFGWKIHGKVKAGVDPREAYKRALDRQVAFLAPRPAYRAYRSELHSMAGVSKRWKLHAAVGLMPQDPDGVWSEACDGFGDNIHADIDEVSHLCDLYLAAEREAKSLKGEPAEA